MQAIHTNSAPSAIGVYSQAVLHESLVFLSGQIGLNVQTMALVSEDISEQIEQVFRNLLAVCEAAGGSLADMVKIQVYLVDLSHFSLVNEAMERYFSKPYPARVTLEVNALPKGALVEIDGIMAVKR